MRIGLTGRAGSGKDTFGKMLSEYLPEYTLYAFASPIKKVVNNLFGWDERHSDGPYKEEIDEYWNFSPRQAYQLFGTEFGRALSPDIWINLAPQNSDVILTDVRFENEAKWVRENGVVVHIRRPDLQEIEQSAHPSEAGVAYSPGDLTVYNDGTPIDLKREAEALSKLLRQV